jgi:hypothetical protein
VIELVKASRAGKACFQELEKLLPSYRIIFKKSIPADYQVNNSKLVIEIPAVLLILLIFVTHPQVKAAEVNPDIIYHWQHIT